MSSLLAAQCRGVSVWRPTKRAFTSAPASTSTATVAAAFAAMPRPVREHVEQGARALVGADPRGRELGVVTQQRGEPVDVAALDGCGRLDREWIVRGQDHRFAADPSYM